MVKVIITAIICITLLEGYALYLGIDGVYLSMGMVVIAGLGGFEVERLLKFLKGRRQ
jgi:hypothetical protein